MRSENDELGGDCPTNKAECKDKRFQNQHGGSRSKTAGNVTNLNVNMQVYINNIELK